MSRRSLLVVPELRTVPHLADQLVVLMPLVVQLRLLVLPLVDQLVVLKVPAVLPRAVQLVVQLAVLKAPAVPLLAVQRVVQLVVPKAPAVLLPAVLRMRVLPLADRKVLAVRLRATLAAMPVVARSNPPAASKFAALPILAKLLS